MRPAGRLPGRSRRAALALLLCAGLLCAVGPPAPGLAAPKPPPVAHQVPATSSAAWALPRFAVDADAAVTPAGALAMKQAGVRLVCFDLNWSTLQPTSLGGYVWYAADASLAALAAQGLDVLLRVGGNPAWAASAPDGPVDLVPVQRFYDFLDAAVAHYSVAPYTVRAWEIYNEPDSTANWGHAAAAYAGVLAQSYTRIKAAAPDALVVMGGLGYDNFEDQNGPFVRSFLPDLLGAGGAAYTDAVNFHHYNSSSWPSLGAAVAALRGTLAAAGVAKPLYWSEGGASSDPRFGGSQARQAAYVVKAYTGAAGQDIASLAWFIWQDFRAPGWYDPFTSDGLRALDGTPKLAYSAYTLVAHTLVSATLVATQTTADLGGNPAAEGYVFQQPDGSGLDVAWAAAGQASATWPVAHVRNVTDIYGTALSYDVQGTQAVVALDADPLYVTLDRPCRFRDVPPGFWAQPYIETLCWQGALGGYADGAFRPGNYATRAQISKMVVLAMGWPIDTSAGPIFGDVPPTDPFYGYVATAAAHGIVSGYADGTFRPTAIVTRGQISKMLTLAKGWAPITPATGDFSDVSPADPFYGYIEAAYAKGVISGYADHTFRPGYAVTRAQLAKMIAGAVAQP